MTKFSISDLEVLFHCHYSPQSHTREDSPTLRAAYELLESLDLIEKLYHDDEHTLEYRTTERGRVHIKQLCELPLPTSAWVDGNGKLIVMN